LKARCSSTRLARKGRRSGSIERHSFDQRARPHLKFGKSLRLWLS
jgi:hypothetical protein